jgi:hypothetical protein
MINSLTVPLTATYFIAIGFLVVAFSDRIKFKNGRNVWKKFAKTFSIIIMIYLLFLLPALF